MKYLIGFFFIGLICADTNARSLKSNSSQLKKSAGFGSAEKSVYFAENKGQIHDGFYQRRDDVLFMGMTPNEQLIITKKGMGHQLKRFQKSATTSQEDFHIGVNSKVEGAFSFFRVDMEWVGANDDVASEKLRPSNDYTNYYNLPFAPDGVLGIRSYSKVRLKNIYDGVDVLFYGNGDAVEYDYELAPGASFEQIKIRINGADAKLDDKGNLLINTPMGTISESAPKVFQNGKELRSAWKQLDAKTWGFEIENYQPEYALVIDPLTRVWGTYYGGDMNDQIYEGDVDQQNNAISGGATLSTNNIATTGAHQVNLLNSKYDGMLVKLNSNGQRLWCTYYGGSNDEYIFGLDADQNSNIYIGGSTNSTTNISTSGAFKQFFYGSTYYSDGFLTKFDSTGTLIWGTYYGVSDIGDNVNCITVDPLGYIYLGGVSNSTTGLATAGVHQTTSSAGAAGILVKFSPSGTRIWGTYYSGINGTTFYDISVDKNYNVIGVGRTSSITGLSTVNSHQGGSGGGGGDGFVVKFGPTGLRKWGTFYGGNGSDYCFAVCTDSSNNIIVVGTTTSSNNMVTTGAHRTIYNNRASDAFIVKFDSLGYRAWGTYYGGNDQNYLEGVCVDFNGDIFVVGRTVSPSDVATSDAYKQYYTGTGTTDGMLVKMTSSGSRILGTYYGGTDADLFIDVSLNSFGELLCFGASASDTGVASNGAYQTSYGGNNLSSPFDGLIVKFGLCKNSYKSISVNACKSYKWHGTTYTSSGDYTYKTNNYIGCDSIVTLKLKILNTVSSVQKIQACDSFRWKGKSYFSNVSVFDTLKSYQLCDSIVERRVNIVNPSIDSLKVKACDKYIWGADTLKFSGVYYDTGINYLGCDSITKLILTVNTSVVTNLKVTTCKRYVWYGNNYDSTGVYSKKLKTYIGCDSILKLNLIIKKYITDTASLNTCMNSIIWRGKTIEKSGIYADTLSVQGTCDTIFVLKLTRTPIGFNLQCVNQYKTLGNAAIFVVKASAVNASYQWQINQGLGWLNLNNAGQFSGVNTDTLKVINVLQSNDNFKFRCIVSIGKCLDTSDIAALYVCPLISEQPVKKYCGIGGNTIYQVKCDIPNTVFQWQADNGSGFQNISNAGLYSGVTTNTLKVRGVAYSDNNTIYRCILTYNQCRDTTNEVALIVLDKNSDNLCNERSFVSVFPNPTNSLVNILLPSEKVGFPYKITNDLGQVVGTGKIQSEVSTIEFKEYPSGVYILTIGEELLDCFKIVKIWEK